MEFIVAGLIVIPWSIIGLFLWGRQMEKEEAAPIDYGNEIEEAMVAAYAQPRTHGNINTERRVFQKLRSMDVNYDLAVSCAEFGTQKTDNYEVALQKAWQQVKKSEE